MENSRYDLVMLGAELLKTGTGRLLSKPLALQAGALTAWFEPDTGWLRTVKAGDCEVVRAVYGAVRDRNWGTITPVFSHLVVEQRANSFRLAFDADCRAGEIHFAWHGQIVGEESGQIRFSFDGVAQSSFLKNRIGLCVLHPLNCAGCICMVETVEGSSQSSAFPKLIAPHQPFKNLRALTHEIGPGLSVEVRLEGEVFETEDQRNWTDASFKTYSTPLELPFPVRIEAGTRVKQKVAITLLAPVAQTSSLLYRRLPACTQAESNSSPGTSADYIETQSGTSRPRPEPVLEIRQDLARAKPAIGLGVASHGQPLTPHEVQRLRALGLNHLRADLRLNGNGWREKLQQATVEARQLQTRLYVALFLTDSAEQELKVLVEHINPVQPPLGMWLIFQQSTPAISQTCLQLAQKYLGTSGVPISAGTNANFAELNRHRLPANPNVFPCFSLNPQVHAFDNRSLAENLEAQAHAVDSAFEFARAPVVVSPITLRPRFNAVATGETKVDPNVLPPEVDVRQMSLFGAAWTLGSVAQLAVSPHVHSLTYYETTGWRGVMETAEPRTSAHARLFPSLPGAVFPMYFVFAWLAGCERVAPLTGIDPLHVGLAGWNADNQPRVLLANLTNEEQQIEFKVAGTTKEWRIQVLDASNAEPAMMEPEQFLAQTGQSLSFQDGVANLCLPPYGLGLAASI